MLTKLSYAASESYVANFKASQRDQIQRPESLEAAVHVPTAGGDVPIPSVIGKLRAIMPKG